MPLSWSFAAAHAVLDGASATTLSKALGASVAIGDGVLAWVTWGSSSTPPSTVLDDLGNVYTLCSAQTDLADGANTQYSRLYFSPITVAGADVTLTFSWGASVAHRGCTLVRGRTGGVIS